MSTDTKERMDVKRYALDKVAVGLREDATGNWVQVTDMWSMEIARDALVATLEREQQARQAEWVAGHRERDQLLSRLSALEGALRQVLDTFAEYERQGEACSLDGNPMIYASWLEGLADIARAALEQSK